MTYEVFCKKVNELDRDWQTKLAMMTYGKWVHDHQLKPYEQIFEEEINKEWEHRDE